MVALDCLHTATQSTVPTNLSEDGKIKTINTKAHKIVRYFLFSVKKKKLTSAHLILLCNIPPV